MGKFLSAPSRAWKVLAGVLVVGLVVTLLPLAQTAFAAPERASLSTLSLDVLSTGTASPVPFDADDEPGNDSGPDNDIVRSRDSVAYRWVWSAATSGNTTFTQVLPAGMNWVVASAAGCVEGAGAISSDGRTLACTLPVSSGQGSYPVTAMTTGLGGQGVALVTSVTDGTRTSNQATVYLSAAPKFDTMLRSATATPVLNDDREVTAFNIPVGVDIVVPKDAVKGFVGREAAAASFSFQIESLATTSGVILSSCQAGRITSLQPAPKISGTYTAENAVPDSGVATCAQPGGADTPITVTVTNMISDLRSYPTRTIDGAVLSSDMAWVGVYVVYIRVPASNFPVDAATSFTSRLTGFDPLSVSGQSNYGEGYTKGQPAGPFSSGVNSIATSVDRRTDNSFSIGARTWAPGTSAVSNTVPVWENASTTAKGDGAAYPGSKYRQGFLLTNNGGAGVDLHNLTVCGVWDQSLTRLDPTIAPGTGGRTPTAVQYGVLDVSTDADRRDVECGKVGDGDMHWFDSLEAAGGPSAVNAVRMAYPDALMGVTSYFAVSFVRVDSSIAVGTPIPTFWQLTSDELSKKSTYIPETNANTGLGTRVVAAEASVRATTSWDVDLAKPGAQRTVTVTPTVSVPAGSDSASARNIVLTTTLPAGVCYVSNSVVPSTPPVTITPGNPGADGVPCTMDAGETGATMEWQLGERTVADPPPAFSFKVNVPITTPTPTELTVTSVIQSPSDLSLASARRSSDVLGLNAAAEFAVMKSASTAVAQPGDSFSYTLGWSNTLGTSAGFGSFVDVLPYSGDRNGTTDLASITLDKVTADPSVSISYTADEPADVLAALDSDPSGATGITWTSEKPEHTTALRIQTPELAPNSVGSISLDVTPHGLLTTTSITNSVTSGVTTASAGSLKDVSPATVRSQASSLSGTVYHDADYSFDLSEGDEGLTPVTVTVDGYSFGADGADNGGPGHGDDIALEEPIEVPTGADGTYSVDGLHSGRYDVTASGAVLDGLLPGETQQEITLPLDTAAADVNLGFFEPLTPPTAAENDTASTHSGDAVTIDVLANDARDPNGDVHVKAYQQGQHGTVAEVDGKLVYTPAADFVGTDTFGYTATDKTRATDTATVTVTVLAHPVAVADAYTVAITGGERQLNLLANDTPAGKVSLDQIVTAPNPEMGTAVIRDGKAYFTPSEGASGTDTFRYQIVDAIGGISSAVVNLTFQAPPTTEAVAVTTGVDAAVDVDLASHIDGVDSAVTATSDPAHGTVELDDDVATYTPDDGYTGTDSFTYTVTDDLGQTATGTVTVTVQPTPAAANLSRTIARDQTTSFTVITEATAPAGVDKIASVTVDTPNHGGAVVVGADKTISYTPANGFTGTESFSYTLTDDLGQESTATITVTVQNGPVAPDVALRTAQDTAISRNLADEASGLDAAVTAVSDPTHGTAELVDGVVTYTPADGFTGADSFTYTVTDSLDQTTTGTVTVTVQSPPTAEIVTTETGKEMPVEVDLTEHIGGTAAAVTSVTAPASGTAVLDDGVVTYTPANGFVGTDSFTYTVTDDLGQTAVGTVTVTVHAPPVAVDDPSIRTGAATPVVVDVLANDTVPNPANTIVTVTGAPGHGVAVVGDNGTITYTPSAGYVGADAFTYTLTDHLGQSSDALVSIQVIDGPVAVADSATTAMDRPVDVNLIGNDQGEGISVTAVGDASNGSVADNGDGTVTYTPHAGFSGADTFTYTITDDLDQTDEGTVTVTVLAPPAPADHEVRTGEQLPITVGVLDGLAPGMTVTSADPEHGTAEVGSDGSITYTPATGFTGTDAFAYTVTDELSQTGTATITVTVQAAPTGEDIRTTTNQDAAVKIDVIAKTTGTNLVIGQISDPSHGTAEVVDGAARSASSQVVYRPAAGYWGTDSFTVQILDDLGQATTVTVTVDVVAAAVSSPTPSPSKPVVDPSDPVLDPSESVTPSPDDEDGSSTVVPNPSGSDTGDPLINTSAGGLLVSAGIAAAVALLLAGLVLILATRRRHRQH